MSHDPPPDTLLVPLPALIELAIDHWRLARSLQNPSAGGPAPVRHAARRIGEFLARLDLACQSLDGHPFDPGLAARVVDAVDEPSLAPGEALVIETLAPIVLWQGRVLRPAEVVTARGLDRNAGEADEQPAS